MEQEKSSSWRTNLVLLVASIVILFAFLEIGIRTYDAVTGEGFFSAERNLISKVRNPRPFRTFGFPIYDDREGARVISSRHAELYPLEKPENTFRIVFLGGSTTANKRAFKRAGIHYPLLVESGLQERLGDRRIEVINVANAAYSTAHSLILLEFDVLSWEPDLIIVSHNINDLLVSYWPDFTFDYSNKYGDSYYYPLPRTLTWSNLLFQHSELYWWLREKVEDLTAAMRPTTLRRESLGDEPDPVALGVFERNLRSFIAIAAANDIPIVLASQPLHRAEELFTRHMAGKPYNETVVYPLHEEFLEHHRVYNEALERTALERGVPFLDNDAVLSGRDEYFIDFVHYTPAGVEELSGNCVDFLIGNGLVQ